MKHTHGLLVTVMGFSIAGSIATAKDWPQFRGPDRNGKSTETGIIKSWEQKAPELLWMGEGMGSGYASVAAPTASLIAIKQPA